MGVVSFFGLGGFSSFLFEDVTPALWETPGNNFMQGEITEDYDKQAHLVNLGMNHTLSLNQNSFLKTTLSYSNEGIEDQIFESKFLQDSLISRMGNYQSKIKKSTYRAATTYHNKLNAKNKIQIGSKYALFFCKLETSIQ